MERREDGSRGRRAGLNQARLLMILCALVALVGYVGCKGPPTMAEQEQSVKANNLALERITSMAVVNVWGEPPHYRNEFIQFFVMPDLSMIPNSRVPLGETPRGWSAGVYAGEGVYFAYPDRGWLLVFLNDWLVYKEELKEKEMGDLLKAWAYEDRFKTRLDGTPMP